MWRNYCIQFMPEFYERQSAEGMEHGGDGSVDNEGVVSPDEMEVIQTVMWDALEERDNSNAGTALLGLDKLSRNHPEFDKNEILTAMLDLANDTDATLANRVTALRLCGERGNTNALETARNIARYGDTTMLRCAAIATLGDIGTDEDLALLKAYTKSRDKRIAEISKTTLDRM